MKKIFKLSVLSFLAFTTFSCEDNDDVTLTPPSSNIVELASSSSDLTSLVAALQAADGNLVEVLSGGEYTVLAPTNQAFDNFLTENNFSSLDAVPTDLLSTILLNHVISGTVNAYNLSTAGAGYTTTNATNADGDFLSLYFNTASGIEFNGVSSVIDGDIAASNGIVHVVDEVIGLPTVVTFATADSTFSTLVAALTRDDLEYDYVSALSLNTTPAPYTVFAPTNEAFGSLLTELELNGLSDIDSETLELTLNTHVVYGTNVREEDLSQDMSVSTEGDLLTISLENGPQIIDMNNRVADIITTDVQANNGVIHVINKVMLPEQD
jgi:uncharacterized surface protein with fasciclin (FAS1) repeats